MERKWKICEIVNDYNFQQKFEYKKNIKTPI